MWSILRCRVLRARTRGLGVWCLDCDNFMGDLYDLRYLVVGGRVVTGGICGLCNIHVVDTLEVIAWAIGA